MVRAHFLNGQQGRGMKLSAPTQIMFIISLVLVGLAVASLFVAVPVIGGHAFWVAVAGYAVLAFGCLFKGV